MSYHFVGLRPFIDAASEARGVVGDAIGKAKSSWHATRIEEALGQLNELDKNPHAPVGAKTAAFEGVKAVITSMVAAVEGCVHAAVEVAEAHGLDASAIDFGAPLAKLEADFAAAKADFEANRKEAADLLAKAQAEAQTLRDEIAAIRAAAKPATPAAPEADPVVAPTVETPAKPAPKPTAK